MFSHIADLLRMFKLRVLAQLGRMGEVGMKLKTLGAFLRMVRLGYFNRLATEDVARVCSCDYVLIRVCQGMVRQWFSRGIFRVLRCMNCSPILAGPTIARFAEADLDATGL